MTELEIAVARHEERIEDLEGATCRIEKKLDRFQGWLMGLMGGVILSLLLLVINLAIIGGK